MKSIQSLKQRFNAILLLAVAGIVLAAAGIHGAKAESTKAKAGDAGVWMIVTHRVEDYARWKPVHDRTATIKHNYGWKKCAVFAVDGDRNHVMVMEQFSGLDRARAFAESTELRDEMAASGVSSQPDIRFVNALQGEPLP
jgi:hypothetical protein